MSFVVKYISSKFERMDIKNMIKNCLYNKELNDDKAKAK